MSHVVLLGDSIFDNAAYVPGEPDVIAQLRRALPSSWRATLSARDGAVASEVPGQLRGIPEDATHLVVSAGGNDALGEGQLLDVRVRSTAEALDLFARAVHGFDRSYAAMLEEVLARELPTAVCTVYFPSFPDEGLQRRAVTALAMFNDVILRRAFLAGIPVLDLRLICDDPRDYANPIEPSSRGGAKIAAAIARMLESEDVPRGRSVVFT